MNIKELLSTEIKKFRYHSTVTLLLIFFTLLMPFVILSLKSIFKESSGPIKFLSELYDLPMIWEYQGYAGSWLVFIFLGFMVLQMYTNEVSYRTVRQNIITGYTKKEFFMAKVVAIVAISLFATAIYTVSCMAIGMYHTPGFDLELVFDNNYAVIRFFLMCLGTLFYALLIAVTFKKGGLSMIMYFLFPLVLEPILRGLTIYGLIKIDKPNWTAMNYWPLNTIEDLFTFPPIRQGADVLNFHKDMSPVHPYWIAIMMSTVFAAGFLYLAWRKFDNTDI